MLLGVFNLIIHTYSFIFYFFSLSSSLLSFYTCSFILFLYPFLGLHISFLFLFSHFLFPSSPHILSFVHAHLFSYFIIFLVSTSPFFFFFLTFFFKLVYTSLFSCFISAPYFLASLDMHLKPHQSWHPTLKSTILEYYAYSSNRSTNPMQPNTTAPNRGQTGDQNLFFISEFK
jgi:hypothetical protein